ncbi:Uncharacterised protein [uncultured archaeon]|nr:Uncharacterised protein [uncultured archaeon]
MAFLFPALVPLVGFLMALIIMATYIGGKVFRIPEMEAYFNVELYNLFLAILIIGGAWGTFNAMDSVSRSILPGGVDPIESSKAFLNSVINTGVLPMYKDLLVIEAGTSMSNSYMVGVGPGVWQFRYKVEPGADAILSMVRLMSFGLLVIYASLSVQYMGLSFIEIGMPILLSLGLLIFILPPTREAGAFLIAFAFAFQTIFPFTFALNEAILNDMACAHFTAAGAACQPYSAYVPSIFGLQVRGISGIVAFLTPFASTVNFQLLIPFINAMAHLALVSLFLPALSITLTVAFINALTKFLTAKT